MIMHTTEEEDLLFLKQTSGKQLNNTVSVESLIDLGRFDLKKILNLIIGVEGRKKGLPQELNWLPITLGVSCLKRFGFVR